MSQNYRRPKGATPSNKGKTYPPEPLTEEEFARLLDACPRKGKLGLRNRALLITMYRTGLRSSEILALYPRDMIEDEQKLRVRHGKNDSHRVVGVDDFTWATIQLWMQERKRLGIDHRCPIFCSIKGVATGRPLDTSALRNLLPALAKKAGIEKRVHPHGLRHSYASHMTREKVDLRVIQRTLGHKWVSTTDRYVNHLNGGEAADVMRNRKWAPASLDAEKGGAE